MKQEATTTQSQEIAASRTSAQHADFLDILIVLAKGRNFILWFTFGVTLLTAIYVFLLPNQYTAETVLMVPAGNSSLAGTLMNQVGESALASVAGLGIKNPGEMYASLFRTRTVEDAVINRFALMARYKTKNMSDARGSFEKHTTVSAGIKDGLLRISVRDTDPKMAADIANGYVEEFHTLSSNLAITEASLFHDRGDALSSTPQSAERIWIEAISSANGQNLTPAIGQVVAMPSLIYC